MQAIGDGAPESQAPPLAPGGFFRVTANSHFAHGEIHQAKRIKREKLRGCDTDLDLGVMVEFVIEDYFGRPCRHAIPIEWCTPCARPSLARRVKSARLPQPQQEHPRP